MAADQRGDGPRDILVIHNPDAGDGAQQVSLLGRILADAGFEPRYVSTDDDWRAALQEPGDLVVLVGGDGTIGRAVRALSGRTIPVAILPTGTANNLAKTLAIGGDMRDVVHGWGEGLVQPLDVWAVQHRSESAPFVEAVGGGLIATVIANAKELERPTFILGSELDRALHLYQEATEEEPARPWRVLVDDVDHSGDYIGVEIMNGPYVGPNIPLAPDAGVGDGSLDVVLIRAHDRPALLERFGSIAEAQAPAPGSMTVVKGSAVRVVPPADVALHLDGVPWHPGLLHGEELAIAHDGVVDVLIGRR